MHRTAVVTALAACAIVGIAEAAALPSVSRQRRATARCRASLECPTAAATHDAWRGVTAFTVSPSGERGDDERAALYLDFEDWRLGARGVRARSEAAAAAPKDAKVAPAALSEAAGRQPRSN